MLLQSTDLHWDLSMKLRTFIPPLHSKLERKSATFIVSITFRCEPKCHYINLGEFVCRRVVHKPLLLTQTLSLTLITGRYVTSTTLCHHDRTRGHTLKLHKHNVRTDLRQHFFTERIINVWNKLDEDTGSATSLNSFKRRLQKMYSDESFPRLT